MQWHPITNAAAALAYIGAVVGFLHIIGSLRRDTPDTLLDGMGVISLFVLSAAVMGFLFFYHPVRMLLEHKKEEALMYFLKTLGAFGALTVLILALVSMQ